MKLTPLKNKDFLTDCEDGLHCFHYRDVFSAIKWLKEEIPIILSYTIGKKLEKLDIDNLLLTIDKAFEDVVKK